MNKDEIQIAQIQERMDYLERKIQERRATGRACDREVAERNEAEWQELKGKRKYFENHLERMRENDQGAAGAIPRYLQRN